MSSLRPPLSFAQQRLWFLEQFASGTALYNVPLVLDIHGSLDVAALSRALDEIVRRHEPLRTVYASDDGLPHQVILAPSSFQLALEALECESGESDEAAIDRAATLEVRRPFDLRTGPVFRARLLRRSATAHVLVVTIHHIAIDGWSLGIFSRELSTLYAAFTAGAPSPLAPLPIRYADFAQRQREWLSGPVFHRQLAYWQEQLRPPLPVLDLPADHSPPPVRGFVGQSHFQLLPQALIDAVESIGRQDGATLFMTLLSAYAVLLHRLTGQSDLLIGTPIANRSRADVEPLIGLFANSLALRLDAQSDLIFRELLAQTKRVAIGAYGNQDLPFDRLVQAVNPERTLSHAPLVQTFFVLDNTPHAAAGTPSAGQVSFVRRRITTGTSKFELTLSIRFAPGGRISSLESSADLFGATTGARLLDEYRQLLELIVANPDTSLRSLGPADSDRRQVPIEWNATARPYPLDETLARMFERQVARTPSAEALIVGGERVQYDELNRRANRVAHLLRHRGVGLEDRVGICLRRSSTLVAAMLGVLKAGAAYVPLDPAYPRDRLTFFARDARCRIILTDASTAALLQSSDCPLVVLGNESTRSGDVVPSNPPPSGTPDSLAYVIYTSGSTGVPKGVAVEHRNVANLVTWALETFSGDELAGMLASTSISFDLSVFELFAPLCSGGTVILVDHLLALPDTEARAQVTFINSVPSVARELLRLATLPPQVMVVALAGERLPRELVDRLYAASPALKVVDLYGPTETTVYATYAWRTRGGPNTIGRPIANTTAHVLDTNMTPVAVGVAGELYLGGAGVARGYLGRPDLTNDRFVVGGSEDIAGKRVYRTGDQVRWRPDGTLEFIGRVDRQLKLRGFRIEPGEIEAALADDASIREALVVACEDESGDLQLVAYLAHAHLRSDDEVYRRLECRLPHYMLPTAIVRVDALPRLPNGKVNLGALPAPAKPARTVAAPRTTTERAIVAVWRELLAVDAIGVHDHFFRLGGHSLLAIELVSRLQRLFGIVVGLDAVFTAPTIAEQAQLIDERAGEPAAAAASPFEASGTPSSWPPDEWAGTTAPYPRHLTIAEQFEAVVGLQPDAPALIHAHGEVTYGELNDRANRLAHLLQPQLGGIGDVAVGVCLDRSPDAIVTLLAIVKSGAAYVPLDPGYPAARLQLLASRFPLECIVSTRALSGHLSGIDRPVLLIDEAQSRLEALPTANLTAVHRPDGLAYVLFTSGTTGTPKAVGIPHRAILRLVFGLPQVPLGKGQTVLHLAPLSFDASTFEIWAPLLRGGRVALAPEGAFSTAALEVCVNTYDVSTMWLTASLFNTVVDERPTALSTVRHLLVGGEALSVPHVRRALAALPDTQIINGYGPTESTTFACSHVVSADDVAGRSIPIGRPLLNTRVYALDSERRRVRTHEPGELWIGGDGLARGYIDDEALTADRFLPDPFVPDPTARMYRTGDRVCFRDGGLLEFLGRVDDQIKIRGFRLEPGDVEAALAQLPAVARAAVAAVDLPAVGRVLVAFVVPRDEAPVRALEPSALREALRQQLPDYMVPSLWVTRRSLPLLPSGKIDRAALPALALERTHAMPDAVPTTHVGTAAVIATVWESLLGWGSIGADDNFFAIGGHSLLAAKAVSRIGAALGVDLALRAIFEAPTIAALAQRIESTKCDASRARRGAAGGPRVH